MGLLDDLKKQAEIVKTQAHVRQSLREESIAIVEDRMQQSFKYLRELLDQLAVIKPVNPMIYSVPGIGDLKNLGFAESFIDYRRKRMNDRDYFDRIAFYIRWTSADSLVVGRDMPEAAQKVRDALFAYRLKFDEEEVRSDRSVARSWRFTVQSALVTDVTIRADHEAARLLVTCKNLERLGAHDFAVPAAEIDETLLEEFARMLLGKPGGFRRFRVLEMPR